MSEYISFEVTTLGIYGLMLLFIGVIIGFYCKYNNKKIIIHSIKQPILTREILEKHHPDLMKALDNIPKLEKERIKEIEENE